MAQFTIKSNVDYPLSGKIMSTINALAYNIDQLLAQHRVLQQEHSQLQIDTSALRQKLSQEQAAHKLTKEAQPTAEKVPNKSLEDDLNHLIGLFDQVTELHYD